MAGDLPITCLYEDKRGPSMGFGLHKFIKACVFDEVDGNRRIFEKLLDDCRPMNGNSKLLKTCREDLNDIAFDGRKIIAVFDDDRVRDLLKLPPEATDVEVVTAVLEECPSPGNLLVFLLERNMETVIEQISGCDASVGERLVRKALDKDREARDVLLDRASRERYRMLRECVLEANPSLKKLVKRICDIVGQAVAA